VLNRIITATKTTTESFTCISSVGKTDGFTVMSSDEAAEPKVIEARAGTSASIVAVDLDGKTTSVSELNTTTTESAVSSQVVRWLIPLRKYMRRMVRIILLN